MTRKTISILGALAASVALAACSTGAESVDAPETAEPVAEIPESNEAPDDTEDTMESFPIDTGWKAWTMGGAELTFDLDVEPNDPRVVDAEKLRAASAADPVSFSVVTVDNRNGLDLVNMYSTKIFTEEGEEFELVSAGSWSSDEWGSETEWTDDQSDYRNLDRSGEELSDADYSALNDLVVETDLDSEVDPGAMKEVILVGPEDLPEEIVSLATEASGAGDPAYGAPEQTR